MPPNPPSNSRLPRLTVWSGYGTGYAAKFFLDKPLLCSFSLQLIFCSEQPFYRNYSTLDSHTNAVRNFSHVCLLVKMASKTVTRSIHLPVFKQNTDESQKLTMNVFQAIFAYFISRSAISQMQTIWIMRQTENMLSRSWRDNESRSLWGVLVPAPISDIELIGEPRGKFVRILSEWASPEQWFA